MVSKYFRLLLVSWLATMIPTGSKSWTSCSRYISICKVNGGNTGRRGNSGRCTGLEIIPCEKKREEDLLVLWYVVIK